MGDIVAPALVVTAWIANCCSKRKEKKMNDYDSASNLLFFRPAEHHDLPRIIQLEEQGYPADEKASADTLTFRQEHAGEFFLAAVQSEGDNDKLVGYTCGTLTDCHSLTHESMIRHDPDGTTLCIHSVCVDKQHRRKGIAKRMLQAYLLYIQQTSTQVREIRLITKQMLIPLYSAAGFDHLGESSIQHGRDQWHDMICLLPHEDSSMPKSS